MADVSWPPYPFDIAMSQFVEHNAWWTGDTAKLHELYTGQSAATHTHAGTPYKGGVVGSLSKMFWGTPIPQGEKRTRVHAPLAAQLATLSADLLFSEPPTIRYPKPADLPEQRTDGGKPKAWKHAQQDRLDAIMGSDETHAELLKAGEYSAALGGAYLSVVWDAALLDRVWLQAFPADCAIPTFKYGRMVACTLWSEIRPDNGSEVFRLLEVHSPGTIRYELYRGTEKTLGELVPMGTRPETAHYDGLRAKAEYEAATAMPGSLKPEVVVSTGIPYLAVEYFPNLLPQRDWRKLGPIANLGRSDFAGIEDQLDKYDEVWTSLLRDVELGRGRITVPESALEPGARGEGGTFDPDREVYSTISALGRADKEVNLTVSQFDIRTEEHLATLDAIKREIARAIGYSEAHLGIRDSATSQQTATEITADFTDSERTRDKKAMHVKPALARIARAAVGIDGVVFPGKGGGLVEELPEIDFPPVSQQDLEKATRIVQSAYVSESMSRRERVKALHPEWDDEQIDAETEAVEAEFAAAAPDPANFTDDPSTQDGARPQQEPAEPEE